MRLLLNSILAIALILGPVAEVRAQSYYQVAEDLGARLDALERNYYLTDGFTNVSVQIQPQTEKSALRKVLDLLPKRSERKIVVSTDSENVVENVLGWAAENPDKEKPAFFALGKLLKDNPLTRLGRRIVDYKNHIVESAKADKIGLMVITITSGYDSLVWLHSTQFSLEKRSAMVALNLAIVLAFGLDKDNWARLSRGTEKRISKLLDLMRVKFDTVSAGTIASAFLANTALSVALQAGRASVLSMDHLLNALTSSSFWTMSLLLGTAISFSSFAWSEQLADIDAQKNPVSKWLARRLVEIRSVIMGVAAPSSKLLQPETFGAAPWIALFAHGAIGLAFWMNAKRVTAYLDSQRWIQEMIDRHSIGDVARAATVATAISVAACGQFLASSPHLPNRSQLPIITVPMNMGEDQLPDPSPISND